MTFRDRDIFFLQKDDAYFITWKARGREQNITFH